MDNKLEKRILSYENIIYEQPTSSLKCNDNPCRCIDGMSGKFESGKISLLKGEENCGKTSLLNIFTGRIQRVIRTYGKVFYNGEERSWPGWSKTVTYIDICNINREKINKKLSHFSEEEKEEFSSYDISKLKERIIFSIKSSLESSTEILIIDNFGGSLTANIEDQIFDILSKYSKDRNAIVMVSGIRFNDNFFYKSDYILNMTKSGVLYQGETKNFDEYFKNNGIVKSGNISVQKYIDIVLYNDGGEYHHKSILTGIIYDNHSIYNHLRNIANPVSTNNIQPSTQAFSLKSLWFFYIEKFRFFNSPIILGILLIYIIFMTTCVIFLNNQCSKNFAIDLSKIISKEDLVNYSGSDSYYISYIWFREVFLGYITFIAGMGSPDMSTDSIPCIDFPYNSFILSHILSHNFIPFLINILVILVTWWWTFRELISYDILVKAIIIGCLYIISQSIVYLLLSLIFQNTLKFYIFMSTYVIFNYDWLQNMIKIASNRYLRFLYCVLILIPCYTLNAIFEVETFKKAVFHIRNKEEESVLSKMYLKFNKKKLEFIGKQIENQGGSDSVTDLINKNRIEAYDIYSLINLPRDTYIVAGIFVVILFTYNLVYIIIQGRRIRPNIRLKL